MRKETSTQQVLTLAQESAIKSAITEAEMLTSGEIRLFIDGRCKHDDPAKSAEIIFQKLKMHETQLRNGVLIYLSVSSRKFAIIGDKGIHEKVGDDFWQKTKELMLSHFKNDQIFEGLLAGIKKAGESLSKEFPGHPDDRNEISNEVIYRA